MDWRVDQGGKTLGQSFEELREICREEGYVLDTGEREDRKVRLARP